MYDLIVIGAGVWGSSAALTALRSGAKSVALVEAGIGPAQESSAKSGGIITDLIWHPYDRQLVRRSRALYRETAELAGDHALWRQTGMLTLGGPAEALSLAARRDELLQQGVAVELLERAELGRRFPAVDRLEQGAFALYTPGDWHVNPTGYALGAVAEARRLGLRLRTGVRATMLEEVADGIIVHLADGEPLHGARALVCAGTWTRKLLRTAGVEVALRPYRTQLASLQLGRPHGLPIVWHLGTDFYLVPDGAQDIMAGDGTEHVESDPDSFRREGDPAFLESVAERLVALTSLGDQAGVRSAWAGLCGATPDRRPLLGQVAPHLYCACGDQGIGVMRGPALGELAAEVALERAEVPDLDPLRFEAVDFPIRSGFTLV